MPKFLFEASYTLDGVKGVQSAGGTSRRDAVAQVAESVGGRLESFHFAFGDRDAYVVVDLPDNESAAAVALTVNAAGGATVRTVVLLTPEEVDAAAKRSVDYRPPGKLRAPSTEPRQRDAHRLGARIDEHERRPSAAATAPSVPLPANRSRHRSPGRDEACTMRRSTPSGFCVG